MTDKHVQQFHASMNDHNGQYKSFTGDGLTFVVEFERFRRMGSKPDRGRIVVWEKPRGSDPRNTRWTDRVSKYSKYDELEKIYDDLNDIEAMRELIDEKNEQRD